MKRKYTTRIHVQRVKRVLEKPDPCNLCPASRRYQPGHNAKEMWFDSFGCEGTVFPVDNDPCIICRKFLGLGGRPWRCPCKQLGKEEAIRRAHLAVEKWEEKNEREITEGEDV